MAGEQPTGSELGPIRLVLAGDVMTGRGIDQILSHPSDPRLHEDWRDIYSAIDFVRLAEEVNGPIPRPVDDDYVWGDALPAIADFAPHARLFNLETAVTTCDHRAPKRMNFRMNPANIGCIHAVRPTCCILANNHILDWGRAGLVETLKHLRRAELHYAGAGDDCGEAWRPAVVPLPAKRRLLVLACAWSDSGMPRSWAAAAGRPGLALLDNLSREQAEAIGARVAAIRRPDDILVVSIHWGRNFDYRLAAEQRSFAHHLIDLAGADCVHGHSPHHPKGIEVHEGRLILYGCGDLLNDYEGLVQRTHTQRVMRRLRGLLKTGYRPDLAMLYFVTLDGRTRRCSSLDMVPFQIKTMRLQTAAERDVAWLRAVLDRTSRRLGSRIGSSGRGILKLLNDDLSSMR